jgi:nitrite reductase/ring-hydroxylating ferredoxin subunit
MARVFVGRTSDIPEGKMIHIKVNERKDILVANVGGNYYDINNTYSHAGAKLHEGKLNDKEFTCLKYYLQRIRLHFLNTSVLIDRQ